MNLQTTIRVSIVEDNKKLRESLAMLLGASGFLCVSSHETVEEAQKEITRHNPDVVLMDINLPGMSGIEGIPLLKAALPHLKVIMLTVHEDETQLFKALRAGVDGYLLKRTPPARILEAITDVIQGSAPLSGQIARMVVQYFHQQQTPAANKQLTPREKEILDQLARGYQNKEIAISLGMSADTVRAHLRNIYEKLNVSSRTEAVVKYLAR